MDKCRICLEYRKSLFSLYDLDGEISYIDMVNFIAAKKIFINNQVPNKICHLCRRKLKEAYDFKILIQRSNLELNDKQSKVINFSNLNDIKIKIEISEPDKQSDDTYFAEMFKNEKQYIAYNQVLIKKVCIDTEKETKPIPVLDFLNTIKNETTFKHENANDYTFELDTEDFNMDNDSNEYIPWKPIKRKKIKKRHSPGSNVINNNICIKPVYLNNVSVMYHDRNDNVKKKYKYPPRVRKDICPFCGKVTVSLKSHILIHKDKGERSFKCEMCSKGFFSKHHLKSHMRRHVGARNFQCDQCVAAFVDKTSLKSHMTCHSDQKNYTCDVCNKGFKRKNALRRHVKIHNFGNKTVKCELCDMSFYNNVGLRHHMRVHTGERPFKCDICSQPYSYKHDFNRHCFKKHGIFLKRRSIYVMNEEVLMQERALMKDLFLRTQGIMKDDNKPLNPFEGPQAALAFEQAVRALTTRQINVDL